MSTNITVKTKHIADSITALIKKIIRQKGLVSDENKPHLVDSIKAKVEIKNNDIDIQITGFYYFKFLNEKYGIMDEMYKSNEYKLIKKEFFTIYKQLIIEEFKNINKK